MTASQRGRAAMLRAEACEAMAVASERDAEAYRVEGDDERAATYQQHAESYAATALVYRRVAATMGVREAA